MFTISNINVGYKGVFITRTCFHDVSHFSSENYHFCSREILQYMYIARTCLRNEQFFFGAKTNHFDVIMFRKINFQALTVTNHIFWSNITFSSQKLIFTFLFG